jgi:hypothetical protein
MDLREIGWDGVGSYGMDCIDVVPDRDKRRALVNKVINIRVPSNARKVLGGCTIGSFSRRAQFRE